MAESWMSLLRGLQELLVVLSYEIKNSPETGNGRAVLGM